MFICVAGKNNIAINVTDYLLSLDCDFELGIICNRTETGKNTWQRSFRLYARQHNIKEYELEEIYEIDNLIFISLEFDRLIRPHNFKNARLYNVHFSLLPAYKGMYTSALPILMNEQKTGVTFHRIDAGIDTGEIIAQKSFEIAEMTARDLYLNYIRYGTQLVIDCIKTVIQGKEVSHPQSAIGSSYYSKNAIDYSHLCVDLNQTACGVQNQIRAYSFREYQMPQINRIQYIDAEVTNIRSIERPGYVIYENESEIMFSTIDYNIVLFKDRFEQLMNACKIGDFSIVKEICTVRKHINEKDSDGWTPLMVATYNNHKDIVEFLVSHGATIAEVNNNGTNLLMFAKDAYKNYADNSLYLFFKRLGLSEFRQDYYGNDLYYYFSLDNIKEEDLLAV